MKVSLFDYFLPADRIAQQPRPRGTSRLLVLDRRTGAVRHRRFADLPRLLLPRDLVVRNDARVRYARLFGVDPDGRPVEILLLEPLDPERTRWAALARPGRRAKEGRRIRFSPALEGLVELVSAEGKRTVRFDRSIGEEVLEAIGHVPLPPYIRRPSGAPDRAEDREAYQTIFAREPLAVAAPTAGLHFTGAILDELRRRGVAIADLTLAVGAGTFKPVRVEDTSDHVMESEEVRLPTETLAAAELARQTGGRVVAVGTTVTRALEAASRLPEIPAAQGVRRFSTKLFITPGFNFRAIDVLLTNFHLPRSTLLMLVCAFGGRENVLAAYEEAVREGYLFYSFGDAMLLA